MLREAEPYDYQPARHNTEELLERSTIRRYWRRYLLWDLSILWWLRRSRTGRFFSLPMRHVIAYEPWRDISLVTWLAWVVTIFFSGYKDSVNCILNCGGVLFVRALIQARRPIEFDVRLRQLADRSRGNYGMPCINTHMAVVVFGLLARSATWKPQYFEFKWWWWEPLVWTTAFMLVALIAFSRLVAGSRFVYQVVLSVFTGIKGVAIAAHYVVDRIPDWREEWWRLGKNGPHTILLLALTFFGLAYVAAAAEDNSSWFFSIPNEEFTRVLGDIYSQRGGAAPRRRGPNGASYAPPDSLSLLTARMRERSARPVPVASDGWG